MNMHSFRRVVCILLLFATACERRPAELKFKPIDLEDCLNRETQFSALCVERHPSLRLDEEGNILSIDFPLRNNGRALALYQQFATGEFELPIRRSESADRVLESWFQQLTIPAGSPRSIHVTGHADIAKVSALTGASEGCWKREWPNEMKVTGGFPRTDASNECLALMRAASTAKLILDLGFYRQGDKLSVSFDSSPFMENTNQDLDGQLFLFTLLESKVEEIKADLKVPDGYQHSDVDSYPIIQQTIRDNQSSYRTRLLPFRSVVIAVRECENAECT